MLLTITVNSVHCLLLCYCCIPHIFYSAQSFLKYLGMTAEKWQLSIISYFQHMHGQRLYLDLRVFAYHISPLTLYIFERYREMLALYSMYCNAHIVQLHLFC